MPSKKKPKPTKKKPKPKPKPSTKKPKPTKKKPKPTKKKPKPTKKNPKPTKKKPMSSKNIISVGSSKRSVEEPVITKYVNLIPYARCKQKLDSKLEELNDDDHGTYLNGEFIDIKTYISPLFNQLNQFTSMDTAINSNIMKRECLNMSKCSSSIDGVLSCEHGIDTLSIGNSIDNMTLKYKAISLTSENTLKCPPSKLLFLVEVLLCKLYMDPITFLELCENIGYDEENIIKDVHKLTANMAAVLDKKMSIAPNKDHKYYLLHLINADICAISGLLETDEFRWDINISYPTYMKDKIRKIYVTHGVSYSEDDIIQELKLNYKWPSMQPPQARPEARPPPRYQEPPPVYDGGDYVGHDIEV
jgi:hypothetical protein